MASDREREPVPTATAASSAKLDPALLAPVEAACGMLGRYRIEHELGSGAMGVVHAAFDTALERRVALKVLRSPNATPEARYRLMREARAMARLANPNVVGVHEVGTANSRDFVAMELIQGETLAEWLRSTRRPRAAILDAFLAAGRGLAAAHAAGIVHRDFKPHNVLRDRDGRIVVTDFGLARGAEGVACDVRDADAASSDASGASSLGGLTVTGALLGTPPYMAPEQWTRGPITPATDQFAYCVALWEALAGERPYRGLGCEELRAQVLRGPVILDASRIPRRFRALLRRGLDPEPARRWPTMDAVLAQLQRARRRPRIVRTLAAAIAAVAMLVVATRGGSASHSACAPPYRDPARVWSPALAAEVRQKLSDGHAAVLDGAYHDWEAARAKACTAPPRVRVEQLQCLDAVAARFVLLRLAYLRVPDTTSEALQAQLVDPAICHQASPTDVPLLTLRPSRSDVAAYALYAQSETEHKPDDAEITTLIEAPTTGPCGRVIATLAFCLASRNAPRMRSLMVDALVTADQCADERVLADFWIQDVRVHSESPIIGPRGEAAIRQADAAAVRVMQPELAAPLALYRAVVAHQRGRWNEAFDWIEDELAAYRARGLLGGQLQAVIMRNYLRLGRAEPSDLAAIADDVSTWRTVAEASHRTELARQLDALAAQAQFRLGDVSAAHASLIRLWRAQPHNEPSRGARKIVGEVVDRSGRPVAGATVASGSQLLADSVGIGLPDLDPFEDFRDLDLRTAVTDNAGRFVIDAAAPSGVIAAQLADRRSAPRRISDRVTLVLESTRSIRGKVELGAAPYTRVHIHALPLGDSTGKFALLAPIAPDGSFTLAGAPLDAIQIGVFLRDNREYDERIEYTTLPASAAATTALRLGIDASTRVVDVVVHSTAVTPVEGALVALIAGRHSIRTFDELLRLRSVSKQYSPAAALPRLQLPDSIRGKTQSDDLVAHFEHVRSSELTVCATTYGDVLDPRARRATVDHRAEISVACKQIGAKTALVELSVPPHPRFD